MSKGYVELQREKQGLEDKLKEVEKKLMSYSKKFRIHQLIKDGNVDIMSFQCQIANDTVVSTGAILWNGVKDLYGYLDDKPHIPPVTLYKVIDIVRLQQSYIDTANTHFRQILHIFLDTDFIGPNITDELKSKLRSISKLKEFRQKIEGTEITFSLENK